MNSDPFILKEIRTGNWYPNTKFRATLDLKYESNMKIVVFN